MKPAVAIIMPTFRQARFIGDAIRSVLNQTRDDWELVVIDDGSDDGTQEIAASFNDPRIRVLSREHRGLLRLAEAYADGLNESVAPLVAILEGDDTWPREKLERQLGHFDDPAVVLGYGAAGLIDDAGCTYAEYRRRPNGNAAHNRPIGSIVPYLLRQNFIVAATVVVRRSALQGGFWQPQGIPYVDHPTWLRLALRGQFAYCPEIVGNWRRHAGQFTTSTATHAPPDNSPFLRDVLEEAISTDLIADPGAVASRLDSLGARQATWTDLARLRLALLTGSHADARAAARPLLQRRPGWPKWTALALAGLGLRIAGGDLEWLFRATNRFSWPSRRHRHRATPHR